MFDMDKSSRKDAIKRKLDVGPDNGLTSPVNTEELDGLQDEGVVSPEAPAGAGSGEELNDVIEQLAMLGEGLSPEKQQLVAQALELLSQAAAQPEGAPEESGTAPEEGEDLSNMKGGVPTKAQSVG